MSTWSIPAPNDSAPLYRNPRHAGPLGFFRKHLDGDYSLPRSYWLHLYIGTQVFEGVSNGVLVTVSDNYPVRYASALAILLIIGAYAWWIFLALGTWASSGKHAGRGGNAGWAGVAKFFIVIGVLVQLSGTVVMAQALREHWDALRGEQPGPPAAFYLSSDARSLTLEGGINDGVAGQLEAILARSPRVTTLVLASGGGWTREGRLLGDIVAARGLNTHVATECSSACTLAFLAGKVRSASEDAQLGFHRFGPGDRKTGEAAARKAYARLLMNGDFILKVTDTSPDDMWYPEAAELVGYKVLTQAPGQAVPAPGGALTKL